MRVAFVLQDLQLSGGVGVVVEHAAGLRSAHGVDAQLVLAEEELHPRWPYRGLADLPVIALDEAREQEWDVAVATWWRTTQSLFDLPARRYAYFIQALEDSLYLPQDPERAAAAMTTALPVSFITEARWIEEILARLQSGNPAYYVRNGIAKDVFEIPGTPARVPESEPLRVILEGAPGVPLKGVDQTLEVVRRMRERAHVTWVTPHGHDGVPEGVDVVRSRLTHAEMADVLGQSHVMLKLSRAEGMYGPPLEAFHRGATVVTTAVTGHDEYVRHDVNGLVTGWDDVPGTARMLDLLARDRDLLARLRAGAVETARQWPGWPECTSAFASALEQIYSSDPPPLRGAGMRLASEMATVTAEMQVRDRLAGDARSAYEAVRSEKAFQLALRVRRRYHRLRSLGRRSAG